MRYTGLLFDNIKADICGSHGIFSGEDVIKLLLSGATSVQIVSTLYINGLTQISDILRDLENWMDSKGYKNLSEFRGKLSKNRLTGNPFVYKRAQYVDLLLNSDEIFEGS
jgi:dihydroorotate dehydrogenase (fumarate)